MSFMDEDDDEKPTVRYQDVRAKQETDKAILVRFGKDDERWVPKSVIGEDSEVFQLNDEGTLEVYEWFVDKNWK